MLRIQRKFLNGAHLQLLQRVQQQRSQSQQAGRKSRGGGIVAAAAGGIIIGAAGLLGYAAWSDDNRKFVDDSIPGVHLITDTLLGPVERTQKPTPPALVIPPPSSVYKPASPPPVVSATKTKPAAPKAEDATSVPSKLVNKSAKQEQKKEDKKEAEKTEPVRTTTAAAADTTTPVAVAAAATTAIEIAATDGGKVTLDTVMRNTNRTVTTALDAAERAATVVQQKALVAIKLAESGGLDESSKASIAAAITAAENAFKQAQKDVTELATIIACSRSAGSCSPEKLSLADQAIAELAPAVVKVKTVITNSLNTMLNVELLCRSIRDARSKLSAELQDVLPSISTDDVAKQPELLLSHAYNRITGLEKLITEKHKALEELRAKGPVTTDSDAGGVSEGTLQAELDKLRHQLTLQHRSDLGRQQEELEAEVRGQLKRQAAAHSDHLSDELQKQEHDVTAAWQIKLYDQINKEKDTHFREMAAVRGKLLGLQSAVSARADADRAAHAARQLWLACQSLRNVLRLGRENANSWDEQLHPLSGHLTAITVAAGSDEFVHGIIGSVNSLAAERGVYTEEALRHRFLRVASVARRVAMVPENGGSLIRYLLSYLQSVLLVQAGPMPTDAELLDQAVDIHSLSTFDIIDRARACLAADDLLGGVRWVNQLTGESRHVVHDWCLEARRTLELRQAIDALMAHAAATTATAL
uniref:MICOS complex subunit MIC60 n=1 Tax=Hirondellea gigas TaxID=1518452 RepID=A0A2P2I178_9CRUS